MSFSKIPSDLIFKKNDPQDLRLGDLLEVAPENIENFFVVGGYPDDEGIKANGGRLGAAEAPNRIRKYLYKMTPHLLSSRTPKFTDHGNLEIKSDLDTRQSEAIKEVKAVLAKNAKWIGLGGGHDWGYVDGKAFLESFGEDVLVINFDAHLDVRPDTKGTNSGTPFFKLLSKHKFEFCEIGIQSQCNSKSHLNWLTEQGGKVLFYDDIITSVRSPTEKILSFLEGSTLKRRKAFVSVDIDAFSNAWAPGCSQSFATGLAPDDFFKVFDVLKQRLDVCALGIYEVSPALDVDDRTSKLAAQIVHRFIY